ncbi:MAG: endolytic transglycosylase MltG [Actinomycetota bacterium]
MRLTRRGRAFVVLFILFGLIGVPLLGGAVYLSSIGVTGSSDPGRVVAFEIPEGATTTEVGEILEAEGVIDSAMGFRIASYLEGGTESIQAGKYELPTGLVARDALQRLTESGPIVKFVDVTFPEGSWLEDFARILDRDTHISGKGFLKLLESGKIESSLLPEGSTNFEGLLFPSTYQIVETDTARSVAQRLADEMVKQLDRMGASAEQMGYSPYEIVNVASMVQAEAKVDRDRGKIARVIYNRLDEGIALGIDATVIYALGEHKTSLTETDLQVDSPYNTRQVAGLPPTPIGAPGLSSLEAAAAPADGPWIYYVLSDCEGHHAFSVDYDDFLQDKAAYQRLTC